MRFLSPSSRFFSPPPSLSAPPKAFQPIHAVDPSGLRWIVESFLYFHPHATPEDCDAEVALSLPSSRRANGQMPHDDDRRFCLATPRAYYASVLDHGYCARGGLEEPGWAMRPREALPCKSFGRAELHSVVACRSQATATKDELSLVGCWPNLTWRWGPIEGSFPLFEKR